MSLFALNQQDVADALTNFLNSTGGIPLVFGTLTSAGFDTCLGRAWHRLVADHLRCLARRSVFLLILFVQDGCLWRKAAGRGH